MPAEGVATPAILTGVMTLALGVQFALPATPFPPTAARPIHSGGTHLPQTLGPIGDFPAILLRPLFSPGRSSTAGSAGAQIAPVGVFTLMGLASEGARASAVVRAPDGGVHVLRLGEALDGWRLTSVGGREASLSHGGVTQSLRVGAPPTALPATAGGALPRQGFAPAAAIR